MDSSTALSIAIYSINVAIPVYLLYTTASPFKKTTKTAKSPNRHDQNHKQTEQRIYNEQSRLLSDPYNYQSIPSFETGNLHHGNINGPPSVNPSNNSQFSFIPPTKIMNSTILSSSPIISNHDSACNIPESEIHSDYLKFVSADSTYECDQNDTQSIFKDEYDNSNNKISRKFYLIYTKFMKFDNNYEILSLVFWELSLIFYFIDTLIMFASNDLISILKLSNCLVNLCLVSALSYAKIIKVNKDFIRKSQKPILKIDTNPIVRMYSGPDYQPLSITPTSRFLPNGVFPPNQPNINNYSYSYNNNYNISSYNNSNFDNKMFNSSIFSNSSKDIYYDNLLFDKKNYHSHFNEQFIDTPQEEETEPENEQMNYSLPILATLLALSPIQAASAYPIPNNGSAVNSIGLQQITTSQFFSEFFIYIGMISWIFCQVTRFLNSFKKIEEHKRDMKLINSTLEIIQSILVLVFIEIQTSDNNSGAMFCFLSSNKVVNLCFICCNILINLSNYSLIFYQDEETIKTPIFQHHPNNNIQINELSHDGLGINEIGDIPDQSFWEMPVSLSMSSSNEEDDPFRVDNDNDTVRIHPLGVLEVLDGTRPVES